jgi:uncharacterized membrane protein SirB2
VAEYYFLVKHVHVTCVALSIALFALRGGFALAGSTAFRHPVLRVLPHAIDTVLLTSALLLATIIHQYPFVNGWLTAKVLGLVAYVVLGSLAVRPGRPPRLRAVAYALALVAAGYIVATALHHDPNPLDWG